MKHSILIGGFAALAVILATVFITPKHKKGRVKSQKPGWYINAANACSNCDCSDFCNEITLTGGAGMECCNGECYCNCSAYSAGCRNYDNKKQKCACIKRTLQN